MDAIFPLIVLIAVVVLAAVAESFGADSRDYEPKDAMGGSR
jgi:hypothetical protein